MSTGRGATAAAFERRARRRVTFLPGYSHRMSEFGPISIVVRSSAISRTWSKWHRTRRCHCLRKSEKSRQRPRPLAISSSSSVGSCSRVLGICWLCLIACTPEMHQYNAAACNTQSIGICNRSRNMRLTIVPVVDQALGPSGCRRNHRREADAIWRSLAWRSSQIFGRAWKPYEGGVWVRFAKISDGGAGVATWWDNSWRQLQPLAALLSHLHILALQLCKSLRMTMEKRAGVEASEF